MDVTHKKLLLRPVGTLCKRHPSAKRSREGGKTSRLEHWKPTVDVLLVAGEVDGLETTNLLRRPDNGRTSLPRQAPAGGREGALLDGGRRHLAGQLRAESPGEAPGGHCEGDVRREGERGDVASFVKVCGWGKVWGSGRGGKKRFRFWAVDGEIGDSPDWYVRLAGPVAVGLDPFFLRLGQLVRNFSPISGHDNRRWAPPLVGATNCLRSQSGELPRLGLAGESGDVGYSQVLFSLSVRGPVEGIADVESHYCRVIRQ